MPVEGAPQGGETTWRLRAVVRTLLSPGVWMMIAAHLLTQGVFYLAYRKVDDGTAASPAVMLLFLVVMLGFLFLLGGTYRALASNRQPVDVRAVMRHGRDVFGDFLWLVVRIALVVLVLSFVFRNWLVAQGDATASIPAGWVVLASAALDLLLVYWLPLVFATRSFQLFTTLARALRIGWRRLPQLPFLAVLLLGPALLIGGLPAESPAALRISLALVRELFEWMAYVYCVEYLTRSDSGAPPATAR